MCISYLLYKVKNIYILFSFFFFWKKRKMVPVVRRDQCHRPSPCCLFHTETTTVLFWIPHEPIVTPSHVHPPSPLPLKLITIVTITWIMCGQTVTTKIHLSGVLLVMHWVLWMTHLSTICFFLPCDFQTLPWPESIKTGGSRNVSLLVY